MEDFEITLGNSQKREKADKKETVVNQWETLTHLSNRTMLVDDVLQQVKLGWSIDRITLVGELKDFVWVRDDLEPIRLDFDKIWMIFEDKGVAKSVGQGWVLLDKYGENIAYVERVKFNLTARNSPTSKVAGCKGFGLVQGLAPCA